MAKKAMFSESNKSTNVDKAEGEESSNSFSNNLDISFLKKCGRSFIKQRSQDSKVLKK